KPYTGEKSLGALAAQPLIPFATFFYGEYTQADWSARHIPESLQLSVWLQEYLDEMWDQYIEADLTSGKLDKLIAKAEADIAANQVRDLNKVLRNS
ncbi:MAG: hypothetical protein F6J96_15445, partial [Symploca sp. SIO1C2]|nr:hypothetical protein [Symploca sp. SIO1C2]